jgi:hypothetical protein
MKMSVEKKTATPHSCTPVVPQRAKTGENVARVVMRVKTHLRAGATRQQHNVVQFVNSL